MAKRSLVFRFSAGQRHHRHRRQWTFRSDWLERRAHCSCGRFSRCCFRDRFVGTPRMAVCGGDRDGGCGDHRLSGSRLWHRAQLAARIQRGALQCRPSWC